MKVSKLLVVVLIAFSVVRSITGQDVRTIETRVADLLAQMPARDNQAAAQYMDVMYALGNDGLDMICRQVVPAGTGNDTQVRVAIEGLSRHLSIARNDQRRSVWENKLLEWTGQSGDAEVKTFFLSQLIYVGSDASLPALKALIGDPQLYQAAVQVITAVGGNAATDVLLQSLGSEYSFAAAAVLNGLAALGSPKITGEMLKHASSADEAVRTAAYRALAATGHPDAVDLLTKAAAAASYNWEQTRATAALLDLADNMGANGNVKGMDRILKQVMSKTSSVQYRAVALEIMAGYHGTAVHKELVKAMKTGDTELRGAAMRIAATLEDKSVTGLWVKELKRFSGEPKAEIVAMLGERRDRNALPAVTELLSDGQGIVRQAAVISVAAIAGRDAVNDLVEYMLKYHDDADQVAVSSVLVTLLDGDVTDLLAQKLRGADAEPAGRIIGLLAWSGKKDYFPVVYEYTASEDDGVRASAILALKSLVSENEIPQILALLEKSDNRYETGELQLALVASVSDIPDRDKRADLLLGYLGDETFKAALIPVLARIGGAKAASAVLAEFEKGDSEMRDLCFEALLYWSDHHALNSLYDIVESGNKRFGNASFEAYIRQAVSASVTPEQKLLYLKKILPHALSDERKEMVIEAAGNIRTYQALFLVDRFFEEPELAPVAARSAMKIAMPPSGENIGMTGTLVREILEKSIGNLMGFESDYDKERMRKYIESMPDDEGFVSMFNEKDLSGWQGLVGNPVSRSSMTPAELADRQKEADMKMHENWSVRDGMIWFSGRGDNLCSVKHYGDFEMLVDWIITRHGDSGIYLRGSPQVQIWDTSRVDVGAQVGSGGLYNNQKHPSKPLVVADNQVGEWNTFRIVMEGERVSVWLNGILVVDDVVMENYWDRSMPIFPVEAIELQAHGTDLAFRDIYIREISSDDYSLTPEEKTEGFVSLFNGKNLDSWIGDKVSYIVEDGMIVIRPEKGSGGNLFTEKEYSDFEFRFEFQLTPGANNGLGIRAPLEGDPAYVGMELQILDDTAPIYANLRPYQYHGSVYGVIPARRGYLKPVGEWNYQEVIVKGTAIKIILNGTVIVDGDIAEARDNGTMDGEDHPGLKRESGHIGFLGHGSVVRFRNIRIKEY
ncbi:MAG: family 16 glycoside hydrolase [Bacteroidales bacterium]